MSPTRHLSLCHFGSFCSFRAAIDVKINLRRKKNPTDGMSSVASANVLLVTDSHRPAWTLGRRGVPRGLSANRAWRWCVLRTLRDAKLAQRKGRPIARHHLERLFARRWHEVSDQFDELDKKWFLRRLHRGRHLIGKGKRDSESNE